MQEPLGSLESPFYPHSSPPSEGESCEWRITATHGERILLNVTDMDLPLTENCESDFLEIRDGYWPKSPLLGESSTSVIISESLLSRLSSHVLLTFKRHFKRNLRSLFRIYLCSFPMKITRSL